MAYYNKEVECMERAEIRAHQIDALKKQVKRVYENVPMYRKRMDDAGVKPEDIKELSDLSKLPFTTKQELRDYYPFDLLAVPKKDIVRIQASSGTTGKQIVAGYTRKDIEDWSNAFARQLTAAGAAVYVLSWLALRS